MSITQIMLTDIVKINIRQWSTSKNVHSIRLIDATGKAYDIEVFPVEDRAIQITFGDDDDES